MDRDQALNIDHAMELHEKPLLRYTENLMGSREGACDVVQEAFLQLIRGKWRDGNLSSWLYTVCRNRALDYLKKESRLIPLTIEEPGPAYEAPAVSADEALIQRQMSSNILQRIQLLPENQREVIQLKFSAEKSYREISEITGLSVSNVGFLLHTAIKALRTEMCQPGATSGGN